MEPISVLNEDEQKGGGKNEETERELAKNKQHQTPKNVLPRFPTFFPNEADPASAADWTGKVSDASDVVKTLTKLIERRGRVTYAPFLVIFSGKNRTVP
ncbi:hypothetical protein TNCV_1280631 [Trichonephila clavipes]|nr:hypothetical protein TNCV_1280631 [Trichonephila clavipes]